MSPTGATAARAIGAIGHGVDDASKDQTGWRLFVDVRIDPFLLLLAGGEAGGEGNAHAHQGENPDSMGGHDRCYGLTSCAFRFSL